MKKNGGTRAPAVREGNGKRSEPWRMWVLTMLALGVALLAITLLVEKNSALQNIVTEMRSDVMGSAQNEYPLHFDLPSGWMMTEGCTVMVAGERKSVDCGNTAGIETVAELPVLDRNINPDATRVYLQNTDKLPLFGGIGPHQAVESAYQLDNVAVIKVEEVDEKDLLTKNAEEVTDLGGGFYKVTVCDVVENPECTRFGIWPHEYYFFGETGTYRMSVISTLRGGEQGIEDIVLSAQE